MASSASLRKEAENKRLLAQALEEEERAAELRRSADAAEQSAKNLRAKTGGGAGEIFGVIVGIAFWGGVALWLFGR